MIVAITGSSGGVGSRLVSRHVDAGHKIRVLSRRPRAGLPETVHAYRGDLSSDADVVADFVDGADVLYHCAAEIHDPDKMVAVNVEGTRKLIAAAQGRVRHWVQLGSIAVYGAPESGVITEETPVSPADVYGHSKAAADELVRAAADHGQFSCSIVRPAKVFGAGIDSQNNQILYRLFSIIDKGVFFFIGKPGALTHYIHIENLIEALMRCSAPHVLKNRVYNLSDDCTIEEFVAVIASALGKPPPKLRLPEPPVRFFARALGRIPGFPLNEKRVSAIVNRAAFSRDRIERELGYVPFVPVAEGLRELIRSWKQRA